MLRLKGTWLAILKGIHLCSVCCWLGSGLTLLVLTYGKYAGWITGDAVYGADLASRIADKWVVVNMGAFTCLGTALCYSLFTGWGFFRHRWITIKWIAIIACIFFGMWLGGKEREMLRLSSALGTQTLASPEYLSIMNQYVIGVIIQLAIVVIVIFLSVFRPWKGKAEKKAA